MHVFGSSGYVVFGQPGQSRSMDGYSPEPQDFLSEEEESDLVKYWAVDGPIFPQGTEEQGFVLGGRMRAGVCFCKDFFCIILMG